MVEILTGIAGIFSSAGLGAITGLVGSIITRRDERKQMRLEQQHELQMRELDIREAESEHARALAIIDKKIDMAHAEGEIAQDVKEAEAFATSQEIGNKANGIKGLVRPFITAYLLVIASIITYKLHVLVGGLSALSQDGDIVSLYTQIVGEIMYLATLAVTWWFGARPSGTKRSAF